MTSNVAVSHTGQSSFAVVLTRHLIKRLNAGLRKAVSQKRIEPIV
jgi:hypothetical protein